jgi:tetratricopeptide (TPR) repeat protein
VKHLKKHDWWFFIMDIKQLFDEMNQKLENLNKSLLMDNMKNMDQESTNQEVEQLKAQSEEIVEEWLKFEEKLGYYLRQKMNKKEQKAKATFNVQDYEALYKKLVNLEGGEEEDNKVYSLEWQKGKALYDLLMFDHAIPFLEKAVLADPDNEPAKLYLGQSFLAIQQWEKARYHLQFLMETSQHTDILPLSLHALACVEGLNKNYDKAIYFFEKINMEEVRDEWQSSFIYNHAQTLLYLKRYDPCLDKLMEYYKLNPDDWQGPFLIGKVYLEMGDEEAGLAFWFESLQLQENAELLKEMAKHFEAKTFYQMAAQCYERLLKDKTYREDEEVWFGLAWNYGLSNEIEKSEKTFLQALSLFPDHAELQIAYTWMLILWNKQEKAEKCLFFLTKNYEHHPLVQGLTYLYEGKFGQAMNFLADTYS